MSSALSDLARLPAAMSPTGSACRETFQRLRAFPRLARLFCTDFVFLLGGWWSTAAVVVVGRVERVGSIIYGIDVIDQIARCTARKVCGKLGLWEFGLGRLFE